MRFIPGVSLTFVSRVWVIVIVTISSIVTARYLGPSGKGILAILSSVAGMAWQFGNLGLHVANTYYAARDKSSIPAILSNSILVSLGGGAVIMSIVFVLYSVEPKIFSDIPRWLFLIGIIVIPFQMLVLFLQNIYLGLQRIPAYNGIEITLRSLLTVFVIILLIGLGMGVESVVISQVVIYALVSMGALTAISLAGGFRWDPSWAVFRNTISFGLRSFAACLLQTVIRWDLFFVSYFLGSRGAGLYSVSVQMADFLYLLPSATGTLLFSRVSSFSHGSPEGISFTNKVFRHSILILTIVCSAGALLARPVILTIFGRQFDGSILPFLYLLPGIFALGLLNVLSNYFAGQGYPLPAIYIWIPGGAGSALLNVFLIPHYGVMGAALSTTTAYVITLVFHVWYYLKITGSDLVELLLLSREDWKGLKTLALGAGRRG